MNYRFFALKERDWPYIEAKLGLKMPSDMRGFIAFDDNNICAAVIVFYGLTPNSCNAHWIINKPMVLRHGLFEMIADYIFNQAGKRFMLGRIESNNVKSLKLAKHLNFKEVARLPDGYKDGVDFVFICLDRDDCTYLPKKVEVA